MAAAAPGWRIVEETGKGNEADMGIFLLGGGRLTPMTNLATVCQKGVGVPGARQFVPMTGEAASPGG